MKGISVLKTIGKVGNSQGLIFDAALRELTGLKAGDQVNITVHITPMAPTVDADEAGTRARALIERNAEVFRRLA